MEKRGIDHEELKSMKEGEKQALAKLSKTQRQKRRADLADPSKISTRLSSVLAERFPPEVIVEHIAELLKAEVVTKGGQVRPDTRTRESALKLLMNYTIGLPTQRTENITLNVTPSNEDIQAQIDSSPALRAQLAEMIGMNGNA